MWFVSAFYNDKVLLLYAMLVHLQESTPDDERVPL